MLDLKLILKKPTIVKQTLAKRGFNVDLIDLVIARAKERSELLVKAQNLEAQRNLLSKEIGQKKAQGLETSTLVSQVSALKTQIVTLNDQAEKVSESLTALLLEIPNLPHKSVPLGESEGDNVVLATHSTLGRGLVANVLPHYQIGTNLGILEFEKAVKLAGTRFWAYRGAGAKLVRALQSFMLDLHVRYGYEEWLPPVVVNSKALRGTGQLPKFADDLFKLENLDAYLIPTAEVPLTNLVADEILTLTTPLAFTAYTPCFRAEAGAGGRDVRGLIRGHQFHKVELVKIVRQEDLAKEYGRTLRDAKRVLTQLELPFREVKLCTGDLGFSAAQTVDLEVWIPSEQKYREISSVSSFSDFQARRAGIRYKDNEGQNVFATTINGSGLAIDRTVAAILENYQNADGTVTVPRVLVKFMQQKLLTKDKHV